jgi:hypothetical protein
MGRLRLAAPEHGMTDTLPPKIDSRAAFAAAIRWGFDAAAARSARRIVCVDRDFAEWPLDEPALLDTLTAWLRLPTRRLVLLADRYDEMPRRHARFVRWRADWAHAIDAFSPPTDDGADLPTLLVDDGPISVQLLDAVHWRGRCELDARHAQLWRESLDAVLQRSDPAFPVSHLGL